VSGNAIYVSERFGTIYRLLDLDRTGYFEVKRRFASGYSVTTGILASAQNVVYVSHTGRVTIVRDTNGDTVGDASQQIISGLPNGRHQNNGLAFGPNGKLYITNGSTCDDCVESNPRSATVLEANANGSGLRVFARGLRNTYDIAFDFSGRMWGTDNGSDSPCATIDELNMIRDGGNYGWPYRPACNPWNDGIRPAADLGAHTAATGIELYDGGQFPGYGGSLFLTLWNTNRMLRAVSGGGNPPTASVGTFASGFSNPIDVAVAPNGTLLVLDFGSGRLYRIVHVG
jgi:glucose/arabinose dehydrogenase